MIKYFFTILSVFFVLSVIYTIISYLLLKKNKLKINYKTKKKRTFKHDVIEINTSLDCCEIESKSINSKKLDDQGSKSQLIDDIDELVYVDKLNEENIQPYKEDKKSFYRGEKVKALKDGFGVYMYSENEKYEGFWKNDKMHGIGTYEYSDGSKYIGEFVDGKKHGIGKMIFKNGDIYKGYFYNDFKNGKGVMYKSNGSKKLGLWRDDVKVLDIKPEEFYKISNNYKLDDE